MKTVELRRKGWLLAAVVVLIAVCYCLLGDQLTLENLARYEERFRAFQGEHPLAVYGIAFGLYVTVTGMSLPGGVVLTIVFGFLFGLWRTAILVSFASTAGATLAFLLSRYLLRDIVRYRFGSWLTKIDAAMERDGAFYLFLLRVTPAVPYVALNLVMGLTPIRVRTYWWVSQLGMLPGTCVYAYAGSAFQGRLEELAERGIGGVLDLQVIAALVLLGVFPLVVRRVVRWLRPQAIAEEVVVPEQAARNSVR